MDDSGETKERDQGYVKVEETSDQDHAASLTAQGWDLIKVSRDNDGEVVFLMGRLPALGET
jgi:hypothetical protein